MLCRHVRDHLPKYVQGALGQTDTPAIDQHVTRCADCHRVLGLERALQSALADERIPGPPRDLRIGSC
jgi:hypothetical protein